MDSEHAAADLAAFLQLRSFPLHGSDRLTHSRSRSRSLVLDNATYDDNQKEATDAQPGGIFQRTFCISSSFLSLVYLLCNLN